MKKLISMMLSLAMVFTLAAPAFAAESTPPVEGQVISLDDILTEEDRAFFEKLEAVFPAFEIDENYHLAINLTEEELISTYHFTQSDLDRLDAMFAYQQEYENGYNPSYPQTRIHVEDWKIWLDAADVHALFFAANQVGPAAIVAAFTALASAYPIVGTIVGLFGGWFIVYYVGQALALGKGIYIGINWNGPFPVPVVDLW